MARRLCCISILIVLCYASLCVSKGYAEENTLTALIAEALNQNLKIQAAYHTWKAEEAKILQAASLPDPTIHYTYFGENVETRVGPQEHKYGASQRIPFPPKLVLKTQSQITHAHALKAHYEAVEREVIKDIKFVYYDLFWVDEALQITKEEKDILERFEKVAQTKFESNIIPQQDVLKVAVELSQFINRILSLKQNRKSLVAKMNNLLNRPIDTPINSIPAEKLVMMPYELTALHDMAQTSSQEITVAERDVERAEFEKSLAQWNYVPDFSLGFEYIHVGNGHTTAYNDGADAWMGTVGMTVPLWLHKQIAQVKEKKEALVAQRKNAENVTSTTAYEIEDVYFKIETYWDIISLYETALIPQTRQAFDAAQTGYEADKIDFLTWLDTERVLLQTKLAYYKAITDYQKTVAYLERVVGKGLT